MNLISKKYENILVKSNRFIFAAYLLHNFKSRTYLNYALLQEKIKGCKDARTLFDSA